MRPYVLLYNDEDNVVGGDEQDRLAVVDNQAIVEPVAQALAGLGPVALAKTGRGDPAEIARELQRLGPRCVFNLAEAARGVSALESCIAGLLELLGIPYTGNNPQCRVLIHQRSILGVSRSARERRGC